MSNSLQPLYSPRNSPGQNTGVGSCSLLQGIFPTQGSNPGLPHCRQILYQLSHQGSPRILHWVAFPFSSGSSWSWNWTRVSCVAGRFFTTELLEKPKTNTMKTFKMVYIKKKKTNQGLLHCRQILHHLSYYGSPRITVATEIFNTFVFLPLY